MILLKDSFRLLKTIFKFAFTKHKNAFGHAGWATQISLKAYSIFDFSLSFEKLIII